MRNNQRTVIRKLRIVDEAYRLPKNIRPTAQKWGVQPSQIRKWSQNCTALEAVAERSPSKLTVHTGDAVQHAELESQLYNWVNQLRNEEIGESTQDIIDKAVSIEPAFKNGNERKRREWVYHFLRRHDLTVRVRTLVSQITDSVMQSAKRDYCRRVMTMYNKQVANPKFLCKMDQTPLYMNCAPTRTVHRRGERNVSIRTGGSSSNSITVAVTVAIDGTKLPLFCIIKEKKSGKIQRTLDGISPAGILCAVQEHAWIDADMMRV